ncbi:MAG: hypothetical protein JWO68_1376, partial [Actinomycetia bacterium]|nr:hypothetical protein [Actinomycetes bacterium]
MVAAALLAVGFVALPAAAQTVGDTTPTTTSEPTTTTSEPSITLLPTTSTLEVTTTTLTRRTTTSARRTTTTTVPAGPAITFPATTTTEALSEPV